MNVPRVFVISSRLMFGHGLESLLRQETNFDIVGQETNIDQAIKQMKDLQPNVVILDSENAVSRVTPILHASPGVKVISLSLQNNDLYVYQVKQWIVRETEDLVEAIKANLSDIKTPVGKGSIDENISDIHDEDVTYLG